MIILSGSGKDHLICTVGQFAQASLQTLFLSSGGASWVGCNYAGFIHCAVVAVDVLIVGAGEV